MRHPASQARMATAAAVAGGGVNAMVGGGMFGSNIGGGGGMVCVRMNLACELTCYLHVILTFIYSSFTTVD